MDSGQVEGSEVSTQQADTAQRKSRRGMLRTALGVAAATVGAGALLETQHGTADAAATFQQTATGSGNTAIEGDGTSGAVGVTGTSDSNSGVVGTSTANGGPLPPAAVHGTNTNPPIFSQISPTGATNGGTSGQSTQTIRGVQVLIPFAPVSTSGAGVQGDSSAGHGVVGTSTDFYGVVGTSTKYHGVGGFTANANAAVIGGNNGAGPGVYGQGTTGYGVFALSNSGTGLRAQSNTYNGVAIELAGLIRVTGNAVGQATMPQNSTFFNVYNPGATVNSTILLTPLSDPGVRLFIAQRQNTEFAIGASSPLPKSTVIQYLIIN